MPNGTAGDHPLTDILFHKVEVYGRDADDLIRKISELSSRRELEEWWDREIAWSVDTHLVLSKAKSRLGELLQRAKGKRLGDAAVRPSGSMSEKVC
jgi:hypothetical protein